MSTGRRIFEALIFTVLFAWGVASFVQGAAISLFIQNSDQSHAGDFIGILYSSVIIAFFVGIFRARIASILSFLLGLILIYWLMASDGFSHDAMTTKALFWSIIIRPFLAGALLLIVSSIGPAGQFLRSKR
ncbi:lysylphosphatidylglycerol synthetase-like protein (DUF2156 family) [Stakelama sediminis]|uniref:Lysylphosphatidylglycerol synthetase-like protein (DUF2156 family) n=1 Tax=Stakelama sediminis TaxID=463200 RepID=A0A840Z0G0_9SPHN|nr:hypothetical protein [Stakelama sediminis]MBB5719383.1 lysylphosphatidylglycerol synthetase-like protein (DUF2156 family) [Stakelama sediminis]